MCVGRWLETLFLTIAGNRGAVSVGTLYRPPSGDINLAMEELTVILNKLQRMPVHVMGDFNINLHSKNSRDVKYLETVTLGLGFAPLISTATHEKPGCKPSCIDNIFTNDRVRNHRPWSWNNPSPCYLPML